MLQTVKRFLQHTAKSPSRKSSLVKSINQKQFHGKMSTANDNVSASDLVKFLEVLGNLKVIPVCKSVQIKVIVFTEMSASV